MNFGRKIFDVDPWGQKDKILAESKNFKAIANSSSINEGHVLIVPKNLRIFSASELPQQEYKELMLFENRIKSGIAKVYSGEIIIGEHGAGRNPLLHAKASNSIFEMHKHISPLGNKLTAEDIIAESEMKLIKGYKHFARYAESPYICLNENITTKQMGRQYLLRKIAGRCNNPQLNFQFTLW